MNNTNELNDIAIEAIDSPDDENTSGFTESVEQLEIPHSPLRWAWEFSKKIVIILAIFYFVSQLYFFVLLLLNNTDLGVMISEVNETFRVCIGGYLLKAGCENVIKIYSARLRKAAGLKKEDPTDSDEIFGGGYYG